MGAKNKRKIQKPKKGKLQIKITKLPASSTFTTHQNNINFKYHLKGTALGFP